MHKNTNQLRVNKKHLPFFQAFQAVNHASKQLLDEKLRAAVDRGREDAKLRKMAEEAARQLQREQEWASVRAGRPLTAVPQATDGPPAREAWMTELPPERRPSQQPSQVRGFEGLLFWAQHWVLMEVSGPCLQVLVDKLRLRCLGTSSVL